MIKYQISLVNVWWDNSTIDTRYFNSIQSQTEYFEQLAGGEYSPLANFEMRDNITTRITYRDESTKTPEELVASNYAIVRKVEWNEETKQIDEILNYRYFFAKVYQDSGRQVIAELELDDIQTNYFKHKNTIQNCLINRAHIDRWVNDFFQIPDILTFNSLPNSLLFKKEPIGELSKRIIRKDTPTPLWSGDTTVDLWLKANVSCWLYVFINNRSDDSDTFHNFKCKAITGTSDNEVQTKIFNTDTQFNETGNINSINFGVLVYPIYKRNSKVIKLKNNNNNEFTLHLNDYSGTGITNFKTTNNNTSFVFCEKLSIVSPITINVGNITIDGNGDLILSETADIGDGQASFGSIFATRFSDNSNAFCSITRTFQKNIYSSYYNISDFNMRFNKNEIVGVAHNPKLNPKYYSNDLLTLNLHSNGDSGYNYDLLRLGQTRDLYIEYNEPIQPEITRYFARFKLPLANGLLQNAQNEDYVGDVGSYDATLPMTNTQYANFIANNKNYWLQQNTNMITQIGQTAIGGVAQAVSGNIVGAVANAGSGLLSAYNKGVNLWASSDNLKNAPGSLKNASSNIMFALQVENLQMHITIEQALDCDIKTYDDFINKNGFAVGIVDNITNYDNIRHYFNYIEAEVETITAPISNTEKQRLKERLRAIRFWNTDTIDYSMENYERRLNNE